MIGLVDVSNLLVGLAIGLNINFIFIRYPCSSSLLCGNRVDSRGDLLFAVSRSPLRDQSVFPFPTLEDGFALNGPNIEVKIEQQAIISRDSHLIWALCQLPDTCRKRASFPLLKKPRTLLCVGDNDDLAHEASKGSEQRGKLYHDYKRHSKISINNHVVSLIYSRRYTLVDKIEGSPAIGYTRPLGGSLTHGIYETTCSVFGQHSLDVLRQISSKGVAT